MVSNLEAAFIFCIIWGVGINLRGEGERRKFSSKIFSLVAKYRHAANPEDSGKGETLSVSIKFANDIEVIHSENKEVNLFNYALNLTKSSWTIWKNFTHTTSSMISTNMNELDLHISELVHLNSNLLKIEAVQNHIKTEKKQFYILPTEGYLFVETESSKIAKYFLSFTIPYRRNVFFASTSKNGKTALIKHIIRENYLKGALEAIQSTISLNSSIKEVGSL